MIEISEITFTVCCENHGCEGTRELHCLTQGSDWAAWINDMMQAYRKSDWEGKCRACLDREHESYEAAKRDALR